MADSPPLRDLLDRASKVFALAQSLGWAFQQERQGQGETTGWNRRAPEFDQLCDAVLELRDAMQQPPDGFAIVAGQLRETARVCKLIRALTLKPESRTFADHLEFYPELNSVGEDGLRAVEQVIKSRRPDDPFAFLDDPPKGSPAIVHSGGNIVLRAGDGGPGSDGGALNICGGDGGPGGDGGAVNIRAGDAWEGSPAPESDRVTPEAGSQSLADLIGRVIRRLKAKPDLLRGYIWDTPDTLNMSGINAAAQSIGMGPILAIGEAPAWWTWPNLPQDHPKNQLKIECLTVYHPDGTEYRIRRTGGELDDSSSLPVTEIVARLEAWERKATEVMTVIGASIAINNAKSVKTAGPKPKRSTERGEGSAKLIAALTKHHKYADGGCLNLTHIGNNELARMASVEESTASAFFKKNFKGHSNYIAICRDTSSLVAALKMLNQEFAPHDLYGRRPPGEDDRDVD
ncbi:MAG: hypothetical protein EXS05_19790 [Planctomycetaceae bacterium]|nr:hypothetical protein [Planctomycetaceae bacterium]